MTDLAAQKKRVALEALKWVKPGMKLGLGTGSTVKPFVEGLAGLLLDNVRLCATSRQTELLCEDLGLRIEALDHLGRLDLCVDGADEIDIDLNLIKGGGGALFREKLTWEMADLCIVIADQSKQVDRLGDFGIPIEVEPFGFEGTLSRIHSVLRSHNLPTDFKIRTCGHEIFRSDGGHLIVDFLTGAISDAQSLAQELKSITGLIDHGLFIGLAHRALIAHGEGVSIFESQQQK
jgi:ribose 5-phosphate isomerase A